MRDRPGLWWAAMLVVVGMVIGAAPASAKEGPFTATLTGYVVEPSGKSMAVGPNLQLHEHDVVLRGKLAWFAVTSMPVPVTVHAVDVDFTIPANANLRLAVGLSGGDLGTLPANARAFCEEPRHDTLKSLTQLATAGISALGARLARDTDTCLVDSDGNGDFDKAFVIGTKKAEDRHMVSITPVVFKPRFLDPLPGDSELTIEFLDGSMLQGPSFWMEMKVEGKLQDMAALHFFSLKNPGSGRIRIPRRIPFKPEKLPDALGFGAAGIEVTSFDRSSKTAVARITRDFGVAGFVVEPSPQYIFIYY